MTELAGRPDSRTSRQSGFGLVEGSSDAELVRKLTDSDGVALAELYQRFGKPCYGLALRICGEEGLAEDVVHDVFLTLWRDPWHFDSTRGGLTTALLSLVHSKAVAAARSAGTGSGPRAAVATTDEPSPVTSGSPEAMKRVAAGRVRAALDELPGEQRQVLAAAYFGGHTLREIATFTSAPLGTVKSRMSDGVRRLRSLLTEQLGPDALLVETRTGWEMSR